MKIIIRTILSTLGTLSALAACSLSDIVKVDKPQTGTEIDHEYLDTRAGALGLLYSTLGTLQKGVSKGALDVSLLTDELTSGQNITSSAASSAINKDSRNQEESANGIAGLQFSAYAELQTTRTRAGYARYFLRRQKDSTLNFAISAAYSYEGYAIVMMAENLCSGIPLSEATYDGDAIYGRSLSTDSVLRIAISKFDSAIAVQHDSTSYLWLAKIGKGRALMSLGLYEDAAQTIADVPISATYNLYYTQAITPNIPSPRVLNAFWTNSNDGGSIKPNDRFEITNQEGLNGLIWFVNPESVDPRLPVTVVENNGEYTFPPYVRQQKFINGTVLFKLATGIEARLIEAEYLLSKGESDWIAPLNAARATVGLADTISPSNVTESVDLLFRERALWFYGQATRLADMRRLVRQYGRNVNSVYMIGGYTRSNSIFTYGDVTLFIPGLDEFDRNYNYSGCINRNP